MMEDYTIIVENGVQYLCYKGEKLPGQMKTKIIQVMAHVHNGPAICEATITIRAILKDTK